MPSALRACVLATLLAPVHVFFAGPRALTPRAVRHPALRVPAVVASDEDMTSAYRTLGLTDEATYDEIMDTYVELSEAYAADPARLGALEKAKEAVLDDRLRQRMAGTLKANYEGMQSIDDRPPEKRTPIWVHANNECRLTCTLCARHATSIAKELVGYCKHWPPATPQQLPLPFG